MQARLVLIDDHAMLRDGLRVLIEARPDLKVIGEAGEGREGLELVRKHEPDIAIVDIVLPDMSGIELTRAIVSEGSACQVLILSLHEGRPMVESALRAGAAGYVVKSAAGRELLQAIDALVSRKSYISPSVARQVMDSLGGGARSRYSTLTVREREVLRLIAEGLSTKEIATHFGISLSTANTHRARIMEKLGIHKVANLVRFAIREGFVEP